MANPWDSDPVVGGKTSSPAEFAQVYGGAAERAGKALGVDSKALLGQWGLETGWGKSIIPGTHNLGNIKDFSGSGTLATDNMNGSKDKYRTYASPDAFADDFADLIKRKYPGAVGAGEDIAKFTGALVKGGYAEDPRYADKVKLAAGIAKRRGNPVLETAGKAVNAVMPAANAAGGNPWDDDPIVEPEKTEVNQKPSMMDDVLQGAGNLAAGAVRGAGSIGATLLAPVDAAARAVGVQNDFIGRTDRRQAMDEGLKTAGAQPDSWMYKGGKLGAEIAGTAGAGGLLAKPLQILAGSRYAAGMEPLLTGAAKALQSGGFRVGELAGTGAGTLARIAGGAATGGAAAGLVDPGTAGAGALIGGALPGAAKLAGKAGAGIRSAVTGGGASSEIAALASRAKDLGINIPADRLVNSRPLNAIASGLNYVPFSGRAATEDAMSSQLNKALSKTFGQNSSNVTQALRKAESTLGGQFDDVLRNNTVRIDKQFFDELTEVGNVAAKELGSDALKPITSQIDEIIAKGANGEIDGQAAYNIKRTLDRIGKRNSPEAWHALELKKTLMEALNRSIGPDKASAFATTRQQYGNMLDLQKLAKNGVEGEISVARLANMGNIRNPQMQELADIAAQFVKPRESQHGAMQRAVVGLGAGATGGLPGLAAGVAAGRGMNMALNSNTLKKLMMQPAQKMLGEPETLGLITKGAYRAAPLLPAQ